METIVAKEDKICRLGFRIGMQHLMKMNDNEPPFPFSMMLVEASYQCLVTGQDNLSYLIKKEMSLLLRSLMAERDPENLLREELA